MPESGQMKSIEKMLNNVLDNYKSASIYKIATAWFKGPPPARRVGELMPVLVNKLRYLDTKEIELVGRFSDLQRVALVMVENRIPIAKLSVLLKSEGYTDVKEHLFELICKGFLLIIDENSYRKIDLSRGEVDELLRSSVEVVALPWVKSVVSAPPQIKEKFDDIPKENIKEVYSSRLHELLEGLERLGSLILKNFGYCKVVAGCLGLDPDYS